jgi:hypothetical protein
MRTPERCPKCGAEETDRDDGENGRIWFACGTSVHPTIADDIDQTYECQDTQVEIMQNQIDVLTARAEKAEALAQYRLEAIRVRDRAAQPLDSRCDSQPCLYCGSAGDECYQSCPTVTHPVEVQE